MAASTKDRRNPGVCKQCNAAREQVVYRKRKEYEEKRGHTPSRTHTRGRWWCRVRERVVSGWMVWYGWVFDVIMYANAVHGCEREREVRETRTVPKSDPARRTPTDRGVSGLAAVSLSPAVHKNSHWPFFAFFFLRDGRSRHVPTPNYSGWIRDRCSVKLGENEKS